jgi:hypothetical protein
VIAIKPISAGARQAGAPGMRGSWWYRVFEQQSEIDQAIRFSLSLDPVVAVLPTSFVDLAEKSILAAKAYRPATAADMDGLRELAEKYTPLFKRTASWVEVAPHGEYYRAIV